MEVSKGVSNGIKILIVDDEDELRESLRRKSTRLGYEVLSAGGGQEAIALCQNHSFDVVVTDIRMAKGSGIELIDSLKANFGDHCPAIICISAFSDLTLEGAYTKGVDALLPKPIDSSALFAAIQHFHQNRQQRLAALQRRDDA
jgi:CheY-like chemotaxis protein